MTRSSQLAAPGRRRFLKTVGLVGLSSALAPAARVLAQASGSPGGSAAAKPDTAAAPMGAAQEISEDARALATIVKRRYGQHLSAEQLEAVTRELDGRIQGGKSLRAAKLDNADEPDITFHA
jgi:hypothetical protein